MLAVTRGNFGTEEEYSGRSCCQDLREMTEMEQEIGPIRVSVSTSEDTDEGDHLVLRKMSQGPPRWCRY
jgi:hypothetical protein